MKTEELETEAEKGYEAFVNRIADIPGVISAVADIHGSLCEVQTRTEGRNESTNNAVYDAELAVIQAFPSVTFDFCIIYS